MDNIAEVILGLGPQTVLAKCDVRSTYRNVPVHPYDVAWLGLQWEGETFVDTALPFGLRSAPKLFTVVADAFQYTLQAAKVQFIFHYIDDFLILGWSEEECLTSLQQVQAMANELGLPMEASKTVGPASTLTFLGIEIDVPSSELRLPREKVAELKELLGRWLGKSIA